MTHFDEAAIREQAVRLDERTTIAGVVLDRGDTTWNPTSTKGPLYGPSLVEYLMMPSGISVFEFDQSNEL